MSLKIIGAGAGRTGTESLKQALEQLGFGKCYHMFELMKNPTHLLEWEKLEHDLKPDYDLLFKNYQSAVDFPAAMYYREFMKQYPDAKVILTVRDADKWYNSASKTIFKKIPSLVLALAKVFGLFSKSARSFPKGYDYTTRIVHKGFFSNKIDDREHCKKVFNTWNEEVKRNVPSEKLLVFEVKDGWEPLCKFLSVPVPATAFPKSNDRDTFDKKMTKRIFSTKIENSK